MKTDNVRIKPRPRLWFVILDECQQTRDEKAVGMRVFRGAEDTP